MLTTALTKALGIDHPIIQAGMASDCGANLAAAVSNAGGLGTVGGIGRSPDDLERELAATRAATSRPWSVNIVCFDWAPFAPDLLDVAIAARPKMVTLSFGDTSAYLRDAGGALRLTNAQVTVGNFVAPGDSVRVLGTVALRDGQPVLDIARIVLLQPGTTSPSADTVTTSEAAAALAGARDADLVRIQASSVTDSATAGADYTVTVDDGSGPLVVVIDSVQGIPPTAVVPGDSLRVNGVLVPTGTGSWRLKPRVQADLTVY